MLYFTLIINLALYTSFSNGCDEKSREKYLSFPAGFSIGSSTSAYQIEGAWNISDKGESIWDRLTHTNPDIIKDISNGDIACDSYHKYKEDVQLLKQIGMNYYRFSISWSRLFPRGHVYYLSKDGLNYYNNLIDELVKYNITPVITLYHFDLPQVLEDIGGWTNETIADFFADYAAIVFEEFGDRVKTFVTINEPWFACERYRGEESIFSVSLCKCYYNILIAHARAYHMYNEEFRAQQHGKVGIVIDSPYFFNKHKHDTESSDIAFQFKFGIYAHPIFSEEGDWPTVFKERIAENSKVEGLPQSRLPEFSKELINYIKGTADFLGVNHYSSKLVEPAPKSNRIAYENDHGLIETVDEKWPKSVTGWPQIVPGGFLRLLLQVKKEYDNPLVYIMENGITDAGTLQDNQRLVYLHSYMKAMLMAINIYGCNIRGYAVWSLLDNFEWSNGYKYKFGIVHVDFNSPNRTRTLKASSYWLQNVIRSQKLIPIEPFIRMNHG